MPVDWTLFRAKTKTIKKENTGYHWKLKRIHDLPTSNSFTWSCNLWTEKGNRKRTEVHWVFAHLHSMTKVRFRLKQQKKSLHYKNTKLSSSLIELSLIQLLKFARILLQNPNYVCISVCGHTCLDILPVKRANLLQQSRPTDPRCD